MKCPSCSANHPYKQGMKCNCGYAFLFDPKRDGLTDGKFLALIRSASANDTYHFTLNQLHAQYCRKNVKSPWLPLIGSVIALGLAMFIAVTFQEAIAIAIFPLSLGMVMLIVGLLRLLEAPAPQSKIVQWVNRWKDARGPNSLPKLIEKPGLGEPPPQWPEPDIYDYGVERLLIVERDVLVDLVVKNGLHAEQRALVISESGYPKYLLPLAQRLLKESPELPVFLLHDSTTGGCDLLRRVQQSKLFQIAGHPVIDLGIFPEDVRKMPGLKALQPQKHEFAVPVDAILFGTLAAGLASSLDEQVALGALMQRQAASGTDSSGSFG